MTNKYTWVLGSIEITWFEVAALVESPKNILNFDCNEIFPSHVTFHSYNMTNYAMAFFAKKSKLETLLLQECLTIQRKMRREVNIWAHCACVTSACRIYICYVNYSRYIDTAEGDVKITKRIIQLIEVYLIRSVFSRRLAVFWSIGWELSFSFSHLFA